MNMLINTVKQNLNQAGYAVDKNDITPQTSSTPVPKTEELQAVGAQIVGEDLSHLVADTIEDIKGGNTGVRTTESGSFFSQLVGRLRKKYPGHEVLLRRGK